MRKKLILHNKPAIGEKEILAVQKVFRSKWLIAGREVERFENSVKSYIGVKHALAVANGHAALHLSLMALRIRKGDEVIVPAYCVSDVLNPIYYTGARPVLVDVEKNGFTLDADLIKNIITPHTRVIIVPHLFGFPAAIDRLRNFRIPLIEDCAQALGTSYQGSPVGSFGLLSIFSFYATKIITTGGQGGMVLTNNDELYKDMKNTLNYNAPKTFSIRYNYDMTDSAAAVGNAQWVKLSGFLEKRKIIAIRYSKVLARKNIEYYPKPNDQALNHFRYLIRFPGIRERKTAEKIFSSNHITVISPLSYFEMLPNLLGYPKGNFPNAEKMAETLLSIPIYPELSENEINRIVKVMEKYL